jgi:hypothetical protein
MNSTQSKTATVTTNMINSPQTISLSNTRNKQVSYLISEWLIVINSYQFAQGCTYTAPMIATFPSAISTPGIMLMRAGRAGCALRWDTHAQCWRWPDPHGAQLYAWPAPAGMGSGVRLLEGARAPCKPRC